MVSSSVRRPRLATDRVLRMAYSLALAPTQLVALAFGVVYTMIGLIGFGVTGFDGWTAQLFSEKLLLFPINPLHNFVHIALGLIWMVSSSRLAAAKQVNTVLGAVLVGVAALGFLGVLKFLAIEGSSSADNYLHLATGLVALFFGTVGARPRTYS